MTSALRADQEFVDRLGAALTTSQGMPVPLLALSDEEILALDGPRHDPHFSPTPWISRQADVTPEVAARFGLRSLMLRELTTVEIGPEGPRAAVSDLLRLVQWARTNGTAMLRMTRDVDGVVAGACVGLVQPAHGVSVEEIDLSGRHEFTLRTYVDAAGALADWALPSIEPGPLQPAEVPAAKLGAWLGNALGGEAEVIRVESYRRSADGPSSVQLWSIVRGDRDAVTAVPRVGSDIVDVTPTCTVALRDLLLSRHLVSD